MSNAVITGFTKPVQVRMQLENYQWLREHARTTERSMNFIVNKAIEAARADVKSVSNANSEGQA